MIRWECRKPQLRPPRSFGFSADAGGWNSKNWQAIDEWYEYFINTWIPGQEDHGEIMYLFIEHGFDPLPFVKALKAYNWKDFAPGL